MRSAYWSTFPMLCAALAIVSSCTPAEQNRGGFTPLAEIQISLTNTDGAAVVGAIREFAKHEHLKDDVGGLGRSGRGVNQIRVWITDDSFFYGDDFIDNKTFSFRAYSHEDQAIWRPAWTRLREHLGQSYAVEEIR